MDRLRDEMERNSDETRAALGEAELELKKLEDRRAELLQLISRARTVLGEDDQMEERHDLTLHEAINLVLSDSGEEWMTVSKLTTEVNERNLYRMKDGRPVEGAQVHARVNNYSHLFEKSASRVRLRFQFSTSLAESSGAYWAAHTVIRRTRDGAMMFAETRLAYSVRPSGGQSPEQYVLVLSEDRARKLVARGGFEPDGTDIALLTTTGWQRIQGPQGTAEVA